jgi:hypothetical protein
MYSVPTKHKATASPFSAPLVILFRADGFYLKRCKYRGCDVTEKDTKTAENERVTLLNIPGCLSMDSNLCMG